MWYRSIKLILVFNYQMELINGKLPWSKMITAKDIEEAKKKETFESLCKDQPKTSLEFAKVKIDILYLLTSNNSKFMPYLYLFLIFICFICFKKDSELLGFMLFFLFNQKKKI